MLKKFILAPPLYFTVALTVIYIMGLDAKTNLCFNIGCLISAIGLAINFIAVLMFIKNKTTIIPHNIPSTLQASWVYSFSRNPIYLGMLLILIGGAIASTNFASALPVAVFFIIIDKYIIPIEEKNMEKSFGTAYLKYKEKVRRWI